MEGHSNVLKFVTPLTSIPNVSGLSGHRIFMCNGGDCVDSKGYIVGGTGATENIYSNINGSWATTPSGACASDTDTDIGNLIISSSTLQICTPGKTKVDVVQSSYLLKKANTSYKKYIGNAAQSTIVIMEEPSKV